MSRTALNTSEAATTGTTCPTRKLLTKSLVTRSIPAVYCAPLVPAIESCCAPGTDSWTSHWLTPGRLSRKQPHNSHFRKPPPASKFIPPSERSLMPAITNAPSDAGMARSMRRPRMALKTSGACINHLPDCLSLRDEVLDEPQDAGNADQTARSHGGREPAAATAPLQNGGDDGNAGAYRADHIAKPVDGIEKCAFRLRRGLALHCLAGCRR